MSSDNTKLLLTACASAIGGAALSFAAFKYLEQKKELAAKTEALPRNWRRAPSLLDVSTHEESLVLPHNHEEKMRRRIATRVAVEEDHFTPRQSVTVRVPATSANLGPGCKSSVSTNSF